MRLIKKQKGFTLTPALLILVLLIMGGVTYLIYINTSTKASRKIEKSQLARFAAETGLHFMKGQLSKFNKEIGVGNIVNEWYKVTYNSSCIFYHIIDCPSRDNTTTGISKTSEEIPVKDGGNTIAKYKITLEDGSFLGTKTITGSTSEGFDRYGNKIWSNSTDKNYFKDEKVVRYGIRVDGYSIDSRGEKESSQSIYAVLDVPNNSDMNVFENWSEGFPSKYLLTTDGFEDMPDPLADRYLTLIGGQLITGKVHSNNRIDFLWNGNFDIYNPDRPTNTINEKYTVSHGRWSGAADPSPIAIKEIVRETSQPSNEVTIYGTNFSLDKTKTNIVINGSTPTNPIYVEEGKEIVPPATTETSVGFGTKLKINFPTTTTFPCTIDITSLDRSQTIRYIINSASDIKTNTTDPSYVPPLKIYGLMQVNDRRGFLTQQVYKQTTDYRFIGPPTFPGFNAPYIAWDPTGIEPAYGNFYETTYITEKNVPHNKIKVFDNITYYGYSALNLPNLYYIHAHKAPGENSFPWSATHTHGDIFGMLGVNLTQAVKPTDYLTSAPIVDWGHYHRHGIPQTLLTSVFQVPNDLFFKWGSSTATPDNTLKPKLASSKISPILAPNNFNFSNQRKYADQIMKIILNKNLSKDGSGNFNSLDEIAEDRENGYYVGGLVDFRSTYFGNDLKYYGGGDVLPPNSKITDTATIFVNDDPNDSDYMKVMSSPPNSKYHAYIYRQIPRNGTSISKTNCPIPNDPRINYTANGGIIFIRDGVVRIGGANYRGNVSSTVYTNTLGNNTIIDGNLTIISYSEVKPIDYTDNDITKAIDNKGDIVITGNVIYKNRITPWEKDVIKSDYNYTGFRQYKSSIANPSSTSDFITDSDGKANYLMSVSEKVNGLALIASNDIKIPVSHYKHPSTLENHYTTPAEESSSNCPCKDTITISGELIAGHKLTQTKVADGDTSKNDRLILYGSIYSFLPPNLSYFDRTDPNNRDEEALGRIYLYDKTLAQVQLAGTPAFPNSLTYDFTSYPVIGLTLPRIVPGTWKVVSDGAQ